MSGIVYEKEITVEVDTDLESLKKILDKHNFKVKEEYDLDDIYMVNKDSDLNQPPLEILKDCLLIRHIVVEKRIINMITYKYKKYTDSGEILKQGKVDCHVESVNEAKNLLEVIGYKQLIELKDHLIVYSNDDIEFAVQCVNNKHIYIELEDNQKNNKVYDSTDDMKKDFMKYNIPIKGNNFFVKKAEIELLESFDK